MSAYLELRTTGEAGQANGRHGERRDLCYANYCHPVFWMMLFDESSFTTATEQPDDEQTYILHGQGPMTEREARERGLWEDDEPLAEYPCLVTPSAEGLRRARERWPAVEAVFGDRYVNLFETWLGYVERKALDHIQLDPLEFWAISEDDEEYVAQAKAAIRAFSVPATERRGFLFKKTTLTEEWDTLLLLAQINYDLLGSRVLSDRELCGYGADDNAPWSAEERP